MVCNCRSKRAEGGAAMQGQPGFLLGEQEAWAVLVCLLFKCPACALPPVVALQTSHGQEPKQWREGQA
eukprot:1161275-Pelagomonas_calceolata.AAC.3